MNEKVPLEKKRGRSWLVRERLRQREGERLKRREREGEEIEKEDIRNIF